MGARGECDADEDSFRNEPPRQVPSQAPGGKSMSQAAHSSQIAKFIKTRAPVLYQNVTRKKTTCSSSWLLGLEVFPHADFSLFFRRESSGDPQLSPPRSPA